MVTAPGSRGDHLRFGEQVGAAVAGEEWGLMLRPPTSSGYTNWQSGFPPVSRERTAVGPAAINSIGSLGGFFGPCVIGKNATIGLYFPIGCLVVCAVMPAFPANRGDGAEVVHV
ncbi:hypothetical protein [Actinomadura rugatobispora]|uniref:MFS transporter n=1 Tax=Actinomadura rugatobispora TaxID=1994 RepID=A0ABW1A9Z4_9ACTN|nr:hypothetical protein GCM10010200_047970 [Actinomadura rugatobispora]